MSDFLNEFVPLLHSIPDEAESIKYVLSELIRNAFEHSYSKMGVVVCAQYYKKAQKIAVGIVDRGIGIYKSMEKFHPVKSNLESIELALRPGISGTTANLGGNDYNAGAGLFFTKGIAIHSRKHFLIYTGDAMFKLGKTNARHKVKLVADPKLDRATRFEGLPNFTGTAIGIDLSIEKNDDFKDLFKLIYESYNLETRKKKKEAYKKARFE